MSKKILIVDDDEGILDAVSLILEFEGYTVEKTLKSEEIYTLVDSFKPNVILLDVLMSGNGGRTICKKLKTDEATKHIPIIMISAHPTAKDGAMDCGANDFLAKPFESTDLLKKIKNQLHLE